MKVAVAAGWNRGTGPRQRGLLTRRLLTEKVGDLAQGPQRAEMFGLDRRGLWQPVLQRREDLHPLDRVDPQVVVELHVQLEHLHRVPRLLRHDLQQDLGHGWGRGRGCRGRNRKGGRTVDRFGREIVRNGCPRRRGNRSDPAGHHGQRQGFLRAALLSAASLKDCRCKPLLVLQQRLERVLRRGLPLEKLAVELRGLLRQPLQGSQVLLGLADRLGQVGMVRRWNERNGRAGRLGAGSGTAGREPEAKEDARPLLSE